MKAASHLADLLGDDHDLAVLGTLLRPDDDAGGDGDGAATTGRRAVLAPVDLPSEQADLVRDLVTAERARLQAEARRLGALLYADAPEAWTDRLGAWWRTATLTPARRRRRRRGRRRRTTRRRSRRAPRPDVPPGAGAGRGLTPNVPVGPRPPDGASLRPV